jgi:hypothetical protein
MNTKALYPMMYLTLGHVCFCVLKVFLKKFKFFFSLLQINIFLVFSYHFNDLMSKIIFFLKKKTLFYIFLNKNNFKNKQTTISKTFKKQNGRTAED